MLTIRCGGEPPEVELSATPAGFERLSNVLANLAASDAVEALVEATVSAPQPYERCLSGVRFVKAAGRLSASVAGALLCISGDPAALVLFARNFPVESALPAGFHVHFEATGREDAVSPDSMPLVFCVAGDAAT